MADKKVEQTNMDLEILKQDLTSYIDKEVRNQINDELDKTSRRLIREKNKKILFRDIIIILLLCVIYYLFYLLYSNNYFGKYTVNKEATINSEKETEYQNKDLTKDELKEKYSYLLDDIYINDKSEYLDDFYKGNLTDEIKAYITLNKIKIESEDSIKLIEEENFKTNYEKIFNDYKLVDFIYNGLEVNYIDKIKSYMINDKLEKNTTRIKKEIIDIKEKDNIEITTNEAIYKHDKIYNILTNEEISEDEKDNFTKMLYIFDRNQKLIEIRKVN